MKIFVVGTGGVGGYFGGLLAKAGKDVTFVARGKQYSALKENGLVVKSVVGNFEIKPVQVIGSIAGIKSPDLIIFTVKTYDTEETAKELDKITTEKTTIITFQNGVDNDLQIKKYVKNASVYPGVAYVISSRTTPGVIEQTGGLRKLLFGDRKNPNNPTLKEVEKMMKEANIDATVSDDIEKDLWRKFMFIVAFSGMTAICRQPIGKVLADPITKGLYERCLREAISVATSLGVKIPRDSFESIMTTSKNTAPDSKSSLLVDIENNRKTEIETLNSTLIRLAKEKGIDVPINELIYGAIKLIR